MWMSSNQQYAPQHQDGAGLHEGQGTYSDPRRRVRKESRNKSPQCPQGGGSQQHRDHTQRKLALGELQGDGLKPAHEGWVVKVAPVELQAVQGIVCFVCAEARTHHGDQVHQPRNACDKKSCLAGSESQKSFSRCTHRRFRIAIPFEASARTGMGHF